MKLTPQRKIQVAKPQVDSQEIEAVSRVLKTGRYISGERVQSFEMRFAEYVEVKHAVAVSSGTAALQIALACLEIGPGDEVIVPPLTFFATVASVLHQNAIPLFADIDPDSFCLDPSSVEEVIGPRTRALIVVQLFGNAADMDALQALARRRDLSLIEDCAQAHGTEYRGRRVGGFGDVGIYSFYATKAMTTGEGGALVTNRDDIAERARMIRNHGMADRHHHVLLGGNYRMTEMAAAMGIVQLKKLDSMNAGRIENSSYLRERLSQRRLPWVVLPPVRPEVKHTYFWCPILIEEKSLGHDVDWVQRKLSEQGVEVRRRYLEPLYRQPLLTEKNAYPGGFPFSSPFCEREIDYTDLHLPQAERIAGRILGLPNHPGLNMDDLDRVVDALERLESMRRA